MNPRSPQAPRKPPLTLYGIANCDKVRKARAWLSARKIPYDYVDIKTHPPSLEQFARWVHKLSPQGIINRSGSTWKALGPDLRAYAGARGSAEQLLVMHPLLMRRPILVLTTVDQSEIPHAGFREEDYEAMFADHDEFSAPKPANDVDEM
jgi:arsenate reductase (glutaredoxin)